MAMHDIDIGASAPHVVNAVVEIPRGANVKYELDKSTRIMKMDRVLYSVVLYPANDGYVGRRVNATQRTQLRSPIARRAQISWPALSGSGRVDLRTAGRVRGSGRLCPESSIQRGRRAAGYFRSVRFTTLAVTAENATTTPLIMPRYQSTPAMGAAKLALP